MNMVVQYDSPLNPALDGLIEHASGTSNGIQKLRAEVAASSGGTRFSVSSEDNEVLIEGTFYGEMRNRDWPLCSARLWARDKVNANLITYADGKKFAYHEEYDAVIEID